MILQQYYGKKDMISKEKGYNNTNNNVPTIQQHKKICQVLPPVLLDLLCLYIFCYYIILLYSIIVYQYIILLCQFFRFFRLGCVCVAGCGCGFLLFVYVYYIILLYYIGLLLLGLLLLFLILRVIMILYYVFQ